MSKVDETYNKMLRHVLYRGEKRVNRTGTPTLSVFGYQTEYDISYKKFPILTTKTVNFNAIVTELLWFLKGSDNIAYLHEHGVKIWDEWAHPSGYVGPIYGVQWRKWEARGNIFGFVDQIDEVISSIKRDPYSRRHIVSAWNAGEIDSMALPPCHTMFQFYVTKSGTLDCHLYQRSGDVFLGVPFNITSYCLLTCMVAQQTGLKPGRFIHSFGDLHLYENHVEQAHILLNRSPRKLPKLALTPASSIDDYTHDNFKLEGYNPHPFIKAPVAI